MNKRAEAALAIEKPILSVRRQGRRLTLPVLLLIALAAVSGYFVGTFPEAWMNWAACLGAIAIALLLGVGPVLGWLANRITITNRRVIVRRGFFVHRRSEMPLSRIREVRTKRGPVQRLFGSGDIELLVGIDAPIVLRDVPGSQGIVDALHELIEHNYVTDGPTQTPVWPGPGGVPQAQMPYGAAGSSNFGDTTLLP